LFGFLGTAFGAINAVQINSLQRLTTSNKKKILFLTHINEIQENHLQHLELQNAEQNKIIFNSLRYNPAMLVTVPHQVVLKCSDIIYKIKSTIQHEQSNRLSTELLRGNTKFCFGFVVQSANIRGLEPLIKNPSDLFQVEVSYFYKPAENMLNIFVNVPLVHQENTFSTCVLPNFKWSQTKYFNSSKIG
jgi:hypothetical protein